LWQVTIPSRRLTSRVEVSEGVSQSGPREKPLLSNREKKIVQLVAQGSRNKEIGEELFISEQTVKNHLYNIFDKLGVFGRLELALYAIHHKLISTD
jgi:DNA-binding NarL/FixJ family response regulator